MLDFFCQKEVNPVYHWRLVLPLTISGKSQSAFYPTQQRNLAEMDLETQIRGNGQVLDPA
jgi:hypothetical protein